MRDDKGRYDSKSEFMRWLKAQFPAYNEQMKDAALKAWCARDLHITRAVEAERERAITEARHVIHMNQVNGGWTCSPTEMAIQITAAIRD